jgi:hypothetical protein
MNGGGAPLGTELRLDRPWLPSAVVVSSSRPLCRLWLDEANADGRLEAQLAGAVGPRREGRLSVPDAWSENRSISCPRC